MPTHFKNITAHKISVLSLYRTLLRHSTHLNQIPLPQPALTSYIKQHFKRQKHQMSPQITSNQLEKGYQIEEKLRSLYNEPDEASLNRIVSILKEKRHFQQEKLLNKHGQPIKYDYNSSQPLDKQQRTNYLNKYIQLKQKQGLLPMKIDPKIKNELLIDEALHERAKLDVERAIKRQMKGPYQIKLTYSSNMKFLRFPWKQSPLISKKILDHVKREQTLIDMSQYYDLNKDLYEMENEWERNIGGDDDTWGQCIKEVIESLKNELETERKYFQDYAQNILPLIKSMKQLQVDKIHQKAQLRLNNLIEYSKGITPFEQLLGKETLFQLVERYKFNS